MPAPLDDLRQVKLAKLEKIRALEVDPYPARWSRQDERKSVQSIRESKLGTKATLAGRLMAIRAHGKLTFADLKDESGQIQLSFRENNLSAKVSSAVLISVYQFLDLLDRGDFIAVYGQTFLTESGEPTVEVEELTLLAKSLRPLPSTFFGLKDVEERYRKRHLDLILNPEIKKFFEIRTKVISLVRDFLINRGYLEVETPFLQPIYGGGLARPFKTYHQALESELYLRIATELYLKRLIVGGFERVFELNRVFRNEGVDRSHNPEFTLLETMEAFADYTKNMELVEEMFEWVVYRLFGQRVVTYNNLQIDFKRPWRRITIWQAVKERLGIDFSKIASLEEGLGLAEEFGVTTEKYQQSIGACSVGIFEKVVAPEIVNPTFVTDYPVETAPLAKRRKDEPRLVENFEIYIAGLECGTNYSELNDPLELRERLTTELKRQHLGDFEAHQMDEDFIEALEYGMPPTSGIGPGIDRIVMILANAPSIREVILFPTLKPKQR